jgi:hypothetical protein
MHASQAARTLGPDHGCGRPTAMMVQALNLILLTATEVCCGGARMRSCCDG